MSGEPEIEENEHPTKTVEPYQYWACVERVVDGDTLDLRVAVGFELEMRGRFRLRGIDTPEMFGVRRNTREYRRGKAARDRVEELIPKSKWVEVRTYKAKGREKYGRFLCDIVINGKDLATQLRDEGHAAG